MEWYYRAGVVFAAFRVAIPRSCEKILAERGRMRGKYVNAEEPIDKKRLDAAWRRIQRSVPYAVFEVCMGGDLYADLVKLKHAVAGTRSPCSSPLRARWRRQSGSKARCTILCVANLGFIACCSSAVWRAA